MIFGLVDTYPLYPALFVLYLKGKGSFWDHSNMILTNHAKYRLLERSIEVHDAKKVAKNGRIIKSDPDGIIKQGVSSNGRILTVVVVEQGQKLIIKTAYYGN